MSNIFYSYFKRPITTALTTPAVRTVVICIRTDNYELCDNYDDLIFYEYVMPVLAIRSNVFEIYRRPRQSNAYLAAPQSLDVSAMSLAGWELQEVINSDELLVVNPMEPFGLIDIATLSDKLDEDQFMLRVVSCAWGPDDDAIRFAAIINDMKRVFLKEIEDEDDELLGDLDD